MVWKYYVFQQKILDYSVSIINIICIISFLVLLATTRAQFFEFFKETILKMPSIYLDTLFLMKCKYRSYNSRKLRFQGVLK